MDKVKYTLKIEETKAENRITLGSLASVIAYLIRNLSL